MNRNEFKWDAMFGIKADGTIECLEIGSFGDDVSENTAQAWGCTEIYFRNAEDMTDEEFEMAQNIFNNLFS